jgi:hypothetical protein
VVLHHLGEIILHPYHRLIAGRDDVGDPEMPLVLAERDRDRTALRDDRGRPRREFRQARRRPHGDALMDVDVAHVVRARQRDAMRLRRRLEPLLKLPAFRSRVGVAAGVDDDRADSRSSCLLDERGPAGVRHRDERGVDPFRQRRQRRVARQPQHLGVAGIDREDGPPIPEAPEIADDAEADRVLAGRRADDGDATRREEGADRKRHARVSSAARSRTGS